MKEKCGLLLGAPAVSSSVAAHQGMHWLQQFFGNCTAPSCTFDFIPFQFATMDSSWVYINSIEKYSEHLEQIRIAAYKKKADWFRFEKKETRELFISYLHGRRFKEFESRFIELMEKLS